MRSDAPAPASASAIDVAADPLGALRAGDHDRFLQVLMAESAHRPALLALFLLNLELARIPDAVREPMAGLIRLQWWRDALAADTIDQRHPVLSFLAATDLSARLDRAALGALIDARERELDASPLTRLDQLEAYAASTAGALNQAAARIIEAEPRLVRAAGTVGTAYGLLGILRALPFVVRRTTGAFASPPQDGAPIPPELRPLVETAAARAEDLLTASRHGHGRRAAPVLIQALLARQDLTRLRRYGFDLADARLQSRPPWTLARCLLARTIGRY